LNLTSAGTPHVYGLKAHVAVFPRSRPRCIQPGDVERWRLERKSASGAISMSMLPIYKVTIHARPAADSPTCNPIRAAGTIVDIADNTEFWRCKFDEAGLRRAMRDRGSAAHQSCTKAELQADQAAHPPFGSCRVRPTQWCKVFSTREQLASRYAVSCRADWQKIRPL
jgi:hypothetical protein